MPPGKLETTQMLYSCALIGAEGLLAWLSLGQIFCKRMLNPKIVLGL